MVLVAVEEPVTTLGISKAEARIEFGRVTDRESRIQEEAGARRFGTPPGLQQRRVAERSICTDL